MSKKLIYFVCFVFAFGLCGPIAIGQENQLTNGEFDDGLDSWWSYGSTGFTYEVVSDAGLSGSNALMFDVTDASATASIGIAQEGLILRPGVTYPIGFTARAEQDRQLVVLLQGSVNGTWPDYVFEVVDLTTTAQDYVIEYTHTGDIIGDDAGESLTLYLMLKGQWWAMTGSDLNIKVWLDRVHFGFIPLPDVTAPGNAIQGVPNDGDWPGGEYPALLIDDDSGTKFLHFKGATETTGFRVTASASQSIVTGLTFTTANDAPERDPVAFELSGSNESIDGPYTLIASGDIVDFSDPNNEWPRFTKNETVISFDNEVEYAHYQVLFTAIRDAASANSMQIAEVELLGNKLNAGAPNPANGAEGVVIGTTLSWSAGDTAATHDVYFGTSNPPAFIGNQEATTFYPGPVEVGTTYYWRVDDVEADGTTIHTGDVWSFTTGFSNFAIDISIATGSDDAEEDVGGGSDFAIDLTSSDLEFTSDNDVTDPNDEQIVGIRFVDVGIPAGAAITSASVRFQADDVDDAEHVGDAYVIIDGELSPNPGTFEDTLNNITGRTRTTAQVPWGPAHWATKGEQYLTSDISSVIQEIVDQDGWASGNALVLIFSQDPANASTGVLEAEADPGSDAALLHVEAVVAAATGPSPANGATDVPLDTILSWWPGFGAVSHDGYMGTSSPPAFIGNTPEVTFDPVDFGGLAPSTTYYWQLNAVQADGTTHTGAVWSFTTAPGEATQPDPADKAVGVAIDATLSWLPGAIAASHDVYFGTSSPPALIGNQAEASFDPGPLEMETTYYWQVDEVEADGTTVYTGDIWSFKTPRPGTGTILREVWEGISGTSVSDLTGSPDYPDNPTFSDEMTLFETPTDFGDNFGSRVHGYLHPDTSGDYTFWIATDDNSELWLSTSDSPADAVVIASEDGWAGSRDWQDGPEKSAPISLIGGQKYYISGIYKEGGGGDNLAVAWEGPDSPTRSVIAGYYLSPYVEFKATSPDPADGLIEVSKTVTLSWASGGTAASHDVYFSADQQAVIDGTAFIGNQAETSYTPAGLEKGGTYYWRVDEVEADGTTKHTGDVWSFTVTTLGR